MLIIFRLRVIFGIKDKIRASTVNVSSWSNVRNFTSSANIIPAIIELLNSLVRGKLKIKQPVCRN